MENYSIFFDESQQTIHMRIDKDGELNFVKDKDLQSAIYVFSIFRTDHVHECRQKYLALESKYRSLLGLKDDIEFKSTLGKHHLRQFSLGFKTLNKNNKCFYRDFFRLLIEIEPKIAITFVNKMEHLLRSVIRFPYKDGLYENHFFLSLSKFLSQEGYGDFFRDVRDNPETAMKNLSRRLNAVAYRDRTIKRMENRNRSLREMTKVIKMYDPVIRYSDPIPFDTRIPRDNLMMLLNDLDIDRGSVNLIIDGTDGTYPVFNGLFGNCIYMNSEDEPLIRISDMVAGLYGRMCYALKFEQSRKEFSDDRSDDEKERPRRLFYKWFDLDAETFELYRLAHVALISHNQEYWSTLSLSNAENLVEFVSLLSYIGSFCSFEEYSKINAHEHSNRFESEVIYRLMQSGLYDS
ncbi:MAG: hypothetical protein SPJ57_07425 [Candidatus Methanomethylophilaceae archaeon]|nr:hypothetical protein [Candidatus Methanomethylophilaceae archaeon]